MAKRYIACPFCWGKIKDSAIKCMYCKRWLNTEENPNYSSNEKNSQEEVGNTFKTDTKISRNDNGVLYANDKSVLRLVISFQIVCILWALISYFTNN